MNMEKQQIIEFFENYIFKYIVNDLKILLAIKPGEDGLGACAIPQAISTFATADLLGYLINKDERSDAVWMSLKGLLKNPEYFNVKDGFDLEPDFFEYFKDNFRGMLIHRFSLSKYDIVKDEKDFLFLRNGSRPVFNVSYFTKIVLESIDKIYNGLLYDTLVIPGYSNLDSIVVISKRLKKLKENEKGVEKFGGQFQQTTSTQTTESISRI